MGTLVTGKDGLSGTVLSTDADRTIIRLDTGERISVATNLLRLQDNGNYYLPLTLSELAAAEKRDDKIILPIVAEELDVQREQVTTGIVRVKKVVHEREEVVNEPLLHEEVNVEHVPINRVIDGPVESRQEGDTLIIPIMEEVLVIEKRLMLREEVHITRRQTVKNESQRVTLRQEEAVVERVEPKDPKAGAGSA